MRCAYAVVKDEPGALTVRDCGGGMTVTNDAEAVVADLMAKGLIRPGKRLLYFDSEGALDEITFDANGFTGFALLQGGRP